MTRAPQQPKETEANRVTQAAADLQYYPNHLARSLTTKRTGTVGMVVSDMSNPFFAEIIRGFEATLRPQQYNLIVCNTEDDRSREEEALRLLMGKRVDGIAAAVTSEKWATLQAAQNRAFPLVFLDLKVEGVQGPLVCGDNDLGAYQGVSHLIADGHTRISILAGMPGMSSMQDRLSGYRRALAEHGLPYDEAYVKFSRLDIAHGARQMDALLAQEPRPDAVFISNNLLALGALHALQQSTLFCPEDIALSCFDDAPWMMISDPPLTAVRQPNYDMGALAARFLLQQTHGEMVPRTTITLQPELIVRQSCRADRHGAQMGHPCQWSLHALLVDPPPPLCLSGAHLRVGPPAVKARTLPIRQLAPSIIPCLSPDSRVAHDMLYLCFTQDSHRCLLLRRYKTLPMTRLLSSIT